MSHQGNFSHVASFDLYRNLWVVLPILQMGKGRSREGLGHGQVTQVWPHRVTRGCPEDEGRGARGALGSWCPARQGPFKGPGHGLGRQALPPWVVNVQKLGFLSSQFLNAWIPPPFCGCGDSDPSGLPQATGWTPGWGTLGVAEAGSRGGASGVSG